MEYGHYCSDDFINAASSPDSVPLHPVKSDGMHSLNWLLSLAIKIEQLAMATVK